MIPILYHYSPRSPGSPAIPIIVIVIVPALEFEPVELTEAATSNIGAHSVLAGSADPGDEVPPTNKNIARTEAKHRNLSGCLNVPSSRPGQDASTQPVSVPRDNEHWPSENDPDIPSDGIEDGPELPTDLDMIISRC